MNRIIWMTTATAIIFLSCQTPQKHKTVQEVFESGEIGDAIDWHMPVNTENKERDTLVYKYDTSLLAITSYWTKERKIKVGTIFLYKTKTEGVFIMYDMSGVKMSRTHYKNGQRDGAATSYYDDGLTKKKILFCKDLPMYEVNYNENGSLKDSTNLKK